MVRGKLGEFRRDLLALVDGQRAAPAEPAAGHRVDDLACLADPVYFGRGAK